MPNHVTTILTAKKVVIDALIKTDASGSSIDFGLIVPPPLEGYNDDGGCSHQHPLFNPDAEDPNRNCWYAWNIHNWGTKWNAYSAEWQDLGDGRWEVRFDTAWSHPEQVIKALSQRFDDEVITVSFADEAIGDNVGTYVMVNGAMLDSNFPEAGSEEALDLSCDILAGMTYAEMKAEWEVHEVPITAQN